MAINPIVQWVGGKRQIIKYLLKYMPKEYNNYYEAFVGGGALLFEVLPKTAIINDLNPDLFAVYQCLNNEDNYKELIKQLHNHEEKHNEEYFYKIREEDREKGFDNIDIITKASRMIYLNKSSFNSLYRVNKNGYCNMPFGKRKTIKTYDRKDLLNMFYYFSHNHITILNEDFENAVKNATKNDFVYFDPPYDVWENQEETFARYTKESFEKKDQVRLANLYKQLNNKGCKLMLSNHNTELIQELYKDFNIYIVKANRKINSDGLGRGKVEEVIITNYAIKDKDYNQQSLF